MRVTAKVDYAVRAAIVLARASTTDEPVVKGERIGANQEIPVKYLESILSELRQAGLVRSQRGADGGYWLAKPATEISVAEIIRAVEGPLADVRGERPESLEYPDGTGALQEVWIATRAALRSVLENVSLADLQAGTLAESVRAYLKESSAWDPH